MIDPVVVQAAVSEIGIKIIKAGLLLLAAVIGIRAGSDILRSAASRRYSEPVVVELIVDSGRFFMWFWAILMTLSVLGFSGIAASMGTASGFVALGVAFALKDVIADTVAGAYLAQDSDFNSGDRVIIEGTEGVLEDVGLRKTRLRLENGDLWVVDNSTAEKKWTLISDEE
ncbi:mechanosensitive ion channel family protein [Candidatus Nanohalovita haloferacivicina]|uniref:mechanosensitive ion channel family protein n=1 Tax=Candidatus Nanohalovita haloferacivicina TaxID=2978046 RepID=UPI00325F9C05|nr:Small-conductance mechanosensitive channel [Candidatus Nanohalobia archaeon BNXNv]